jgi:hypothetical protein
MACVLLSSVIADNNTDTIQLISFGMKTSGLPVVDKMNFGPEESEKSLEVS